MRNSDAVRIRRQFRSYAGLAQDMQPGDKVYAAVLPPPGNSRKLQIKWSGPLVITEVVNDAMLRIQELNVKNARTYIAHRSKLRLAKKMGRNDTDPLFRLPRLPKDEMDQISKELEEFELPGKPNQDVIDEFVPFSQENEFYQKIQQSQRKDDSTDDSTCVSSNSSSRTRASEDRISENRSSDEMDEFVSFHRSPESSGSEASNPEQEFSRHFNLENLEIEELNQALHTVVQRMKNQCRLQPS